MNKIGKKAKKAAERAIPHAVKTESQIQQEILLSVSKIDHVRVSRNNIGALRDDRGRLVQFGVFRPGGADIVGIIGPAGRFLAIEVKRPGAKPTKSQEAFAHMIRSMGGLYILATSATQARLDVERAIRSDDNDPVE